MAGLWERSNYWLDKLSSHGVGECSVTAVWPRAGGLSRRRPHEIIVVVEQTIHSKKGDRRMRVSSK